jgi:hypothetical protein
MIAHLDGFAPIVDFFNSIGQEPTWRGSGAGAAVWPAAQDRVQPLTLNASFMMLIVFTV